MTSNTYENKHFTKRDRRTNLILITFRDDKLMIVPVSKVKLSSNKFIFVINIYFTTKDRFVHSYDEIDSRL